MPDRGDSRDVTAGGDYRRLVSLMAGMDGAVVAFSGGIDSSLLLAAAHEALAERVLAVTARSPAHPERELALAAAIARQLGARHRVIDSRELDLPAFRENRPDRCYHCKRDLYAGFRRIADQEGLAELLDGGNRDDRNDYRPGRRAAAECGVRSPLAELGLDKPAIRALARKRGLPNWDLPAGACLASRIPYGDPITPERLRRIEAAETAVAAIGFTLVRVRDYGRLARIELAGADLDRALAPDLRRQLADACRRNGFDHVCLDLDGYRTGSMNETLTTQDGGGPGSG